MRHLSFLAVIALAACGSDNTPHGDEAAIEAEATAGSVSSSSSSSKKAIGNGPFGIEMGTPIKTLGVQSEIEPGFTLLSSVPKPSSEFESYFVIGYETTGVCKVIAKSRDFESDSYGNHVKAYLDNVAELLSAKYGPGKKTDKCFNKCDSPYFQMRLESRGQFYYYDWENQTPAMQAAKIKSIELSAMAAEYNGTSARVLYVFDNEMACDAAEKSLKSSSL